MNSSEGITVSDIGSRYTELVASARGINLDAAGGNPFSKMESELPVADQLVRELSAG